MIRIWSSPHPKDIKSVDNGISQAIYNLSLRIINYGYTYVDVPESADLIVRHAGAQGGPRVDVAHCHGLLPTGMRNLESWAWGVNGHVIDNLVRAKCITVPSQWVGDTIRRDMCVEPHVVEWAIDGNEWDPGACEHYVLWAKGRAGDVCSPEPVNKLATMASDVKFITTFGEQTGNVQSFNQTVPFRQMKELIRNAGVYLATTRETFGIQTLEAMACAVPVLGFDYAATPDIVTHGETGYLARPGDYDDLLAGLRYCIKHRKRLGEAAREVALTYTWDRVASQMAEVYTEALEPHIGPEVSIIIPCYNYAHFVGDAIGSALGQDGGSFEVIVVDDKSTDNSRDVISHYAGRVTTVFKEQNEGVAQARNTGAASANGKYLAFLDSDDMMEPGWLKATLTIMRRNDRLGIAYTPLKGLLQHGGAKVWGWPPRSGMPQAQLTGANTVPTCCLVRKEAFMRAGGYRSRYEPTEDGELWTRIVELGYDIECATEKPLFLYRVGHPSLSRGKSLPDYMAWHQPSKIGRPPFAATGSPPKKSWPVRDYDQPLVSIVVAHREGGLLDGLLDTIDSIVGQTYQFWELLLIVRASGDLDLRPFPFVKVHDVGWDVSSEQLLNYGAKQAKAPLITPALSGDAFDGHFIERALYAWQTRGEIAGCIPLAWWEHVGGMQDGETITEFVNRLAEVGLYKEKKEAWHAEDVQGQHVQGAVVAQAVPA